MNTPTAQEHEDAAISEAYAREIRDFLLGRLSKTHTTGEITAGASEIPERCLAWWIFEGKRYAGVEGMLGAAWPWVDRQLARLRSVHSPRARLLQAPEGEIDWLASAFATVTSGARSYVARATAVGLSDDERGALDGWVGWIAREWHAYVKEVGVPAGVPTDLPRALRPANSAVGAQALRRWAHVAHRSRWPFLRNVVAESLRAVLEPSDLDALPLPTEHEKLFELVCAVRILSALVPRDRRVRWLERHDGETSVDLPGVRWRFQRYLSAADVHASDAYPPALLRALRRHGVPSAGYVDSVFEFAERRSGFGALYVECKSGNQAPVEAVEQMRFYREVVRAWEPRPLLVIGIVERSSNPPCFSPAARAGLLAEVAGGVSDDVYVFASADEIADVLEALALNG